MPASPPPRDELLAALNRAAFVLGRRWRVLIMGAGLGALGGFAYLLIAPPYYEATSALVATEAFPHSTGQGGSLDSLASLAGVTTSTKPLDPFQKFQNVLTSVRLGDQLLRDDRAKSILFPHRWNATTKSWGPPEGPVAWIAGGFNAALGRPAWTAPDGAVAAETLQRKLTVAPSAKGGVVQVSYRSRNPADALYMLSMVENTADRLIRQDYLKVAEGYANYINRQAPDVTNFAPRSTLMSIMADYQQVMIMARANLPFAASPLDPPSVPVSPSGPSAIIALLAGALVGLLLGMASAFLPETWTRRLRVARRATLHRPVNLGIGGPGRKKTA